MFELIRNIDHAYMEAGEFVTESMPDSDISGKAVLRAFPNVFPSLIDWFANQDYRGAKVLDSHICDRSIAKCLIYPKTNKLGKATWHIAKSIEDMPNIVSNSIFFSKDTKIIKTGGFGEVASELEQGEPFLIGIRSLYTRKNPHSLAHVSIVNRTMAKKLVYCKKDTKKIQGYWPPGSKYTLKVLHDEVEVRL